MKNIAILRLNDPISNIEFDKNGSYSLEEIIYSALNIALNSFFSMTIFRDKVYWSNDHKKNRFFEQSYKDAFRCFWGSRFTKYENFASERALWLSKKIYLSLRNHKDAFDDWYTQYQSLIDGTNIFRFKLNVDQEIRFNGDTGSLVLNVFLQEIFLNAMKYSSKSDDGNAIFELNIRISQNDDIKEFAFVNHLRKSSDRNHGKGKYLIKTILKEKLGLIPCKGEKDFIESINGIYKICGEKNEILEDLSYR